MASTLEIGEGGVHQHDVGSQSLGQHDRLVAVGSLADHGDGLPTLEQLADTGADKRLTMRDHHPDLPARGPLPALGWVDEREPAPGRLLRTGRGGNEDGRGHGPRLSPLSGESSIPLPPRPRRWQSGDRG